MMRYPKQYVAYQVEDEDEDGDGDGDEDEDGDGDGDGDTGAIPNATSATGTASRFAARTDSAREHNSARAANSPSPVIDGKLDDTAWQEVGWSEDFQDIVGDDTEVNPEPFILNVEPS